ncbi:uncharacterized protein LOC123261369 [Cotesia glomerata]|uniref:uncharacterized protein LOC123261369 n=1 Tax=Cotesia glomerata TaxID=32391 RepID=UPI001D0256FF|nr:uncharacterized protein LOC123261369 [Cotesia glomerata]
MPLTFVPSQKGKKLLLHGGYLYAKKSTNKNDISWRCAVNVNCNLLIHTDSESKNGNIVGVVPDHDHAGDIAAVQAKVVKGEIVKKAQKSDAKPATVITRALRGVMSPTVALLPQLSSMSRTVNRIRAKENPQPIAAASRQELVLTDDLKITHKGEQFLLHDSGGFRKRYLMFSTEKNLGVLSKCSQWLSDGTFSVVPNIFAQLYTIHGIFKGTSIPLVYVLLPNKLKNTYVDLLGVLRHALPNYTPDSIMVDFESAFIEAFKEKYSGVKIRGCNFHFNQCYWRRIQQCGLQTHYNSDVTFAFHLRLLPALAFIPPGDVIAGYEEILSCNHYDVNSDILESLLSYFEFTWIGETRRNIKKRSNPLFNIKLWNCYAAVIGDETRTNNHVEGWHNGFNRRVGTCHASTNVLINKLKDEQSRSEALITQMDTGMKVAGQRRAYHDYNARLKKVILDYDSADKFNYLRRVAKIISINVDN